MASPRRARLARSCFAPGTHREQIAETSAAQAFPAWLTIADVGGVDVFRILISTHCVVIAIEAARALVLVRQHFLKQEAVFFDVLVYSG